MKEFGLDETVLTEEEMLKRRQRLKSLIKLGKTRGYLTHAEITDHLPDKLVDAETLEVVVVDAQRHGRGRVRADARCRDAAADEHRPDGRDGRRSRRGSRSRPVHRGQRIRPHHRPGAHVHARDGHGGTAHARGRDRDRQAHRGRPDGDDGGDLRLARHHRRDPAHGRGDPRGQDRHLHHRGRLLQPERSRRLRGGGGLRRVRRRRRRRRLGRLQGPDQEARGAQGPGAGALRPHRRPVREGAQGLRQGRLGHARLPQGPARAVRGADDHPLHGQDHREAVRHGARPGRRRAQEGARAAPHHRGQVRHAAGNLHQGLPAQPAEPEVGGEAGRRRQAVERGDRPQRARRSRNCSRS